MFSLSAVRASIANLLTFTYPGRFSRFDTVRQILAALRLSDTMDTTDDTMSSFSDNEIYQILKNGTMHERLQEKFKSAPKVMIGQHQLMFEIGDIDEHFRKKAEEELRETPEVVAQGLKELKELIAGI